MTYSLQQARHNLINAVRLVGDAFGIKARDPKEPGKERKEKFEAKLYRATMRQFRKQKKEIERVLSIQYPERKTTISPPIPDYEWDNIFDDEDYRNEVRRILTAGAQDGVLLFQDMVPLDMDYTLVNRDAANWAIKYSGNLVKDIGKTTKDIIRNAINIFINTPGMTIGDVMRDIIGTGISPWRAQTIAVTEITRAYAKAEELAGIALQKEFPGVQVVKTWWTNNDDRVCDICGPLHGMSVSVIKEGFTTEDDKSLGIPSPPAHVNCRCWMSTTTRIV